MKKSHVIVIVSVILCVAAAAAVYFFTPYGKKLSSKLAEKKAAKVEEPQYKNYVFAANLINLHKSSSEEYKAKYEGQTVQLTLKFVRYDIIPKENTYQGKYGRYVAEFNCGTDDLPRYTSNEIPCFFDGNDASAFAKLKSGDVVTISGVCVEDSDSWSWKLKLRNCKVLKVHSTQGSNPTILMYKIDADNGSTSAMFRLGEIYRTGHGVPVNNKQAIQWYRKAGELGDAKALNNLGVFYAKGILVQKDLEKAFKLYTLAADRGSAVAMCNLGEYYEFGKYVEQDYSKAREWYQKAFENGYQPAEGKLKRVLGK